jgi:hypothetical protein
LEDDFLAFVNGAAGETSCSCHFRLTIDWNGMAYGDATKLALVAGNETKNCEMK